MKHILFIALGGSAGAIARYLISRSLGLSMNSLIPIGTFFVNVTGSFLIGFFYALFDLLIVSNDMKGLLTIGFLGAFTTFSTFSLETVNLFHDGEIKLGLLNILLNNIVCLAMTILGIILARVLIKAVR
jgi:CrcB protein